MGANLSNKLLSKLRSKPYREAYVAEHVRTGTAYQIRAMREQRNNMSQEELGRLMDKPQPVVSRLEDPDYGKLTINTLLEVAAALDVALVVKFVDFPEFLRQTEDVSPEGLKVESFDETALTTSVSAIPAGTFVYILETPTAHHIDPFRTGYVTVGEQSTSVSIDFPGMSDADVQWLGRGVRHG